MRHRKHRRPLYAAQSSKPETSPLDIILDVFDLPSLVNNGTPEIQPSNQQNLRSNVPGNPLKDFSWIQELKVMMGEVLDKMEHFYQRKKL
ncbi:hypothetical protein ACTXT7_002852 [Hymenolepis weldensis]